MKLWKKLVAITRRDQVEADLEAELQAHLELAERDAMARGLSPEDARLAARRSFGGITQMHDEHRDNRGIPWMENLLRDFRHGISVIGRDRATSTVVIGVLALGIGANVAMFSLVDGVLLKPLPFPQPERIVRIWEAPRPGVTNATASLDFLDWQRLSTSTFEAISAEVPLSMTLNGKNEAARLFGKAVTPDYFRVFGVQPLLGRTFQPGETGPVAVITHSAWQTHFAGSPDILNQKIILDGEPLPIIGVMPPGPFDRDRAQFWKTLEFPAEQHSRTMHWLNVQARLRAGVSLAQAREKMAAVRNSMLDVLPANKKEWKIVLESLDTLMVGRGLRQSLLVAFGAVFLVLLIACANVASLLLAKGATRSKEMAVRTALGASRGRLVMQLLTESLALCLGGGAAGLTTGYLLIRAAKPFLEGALPYTADVGLDLNVFLFAGAAALGTGVLVSILPALQTAGHSLETALRQSGRNSSGSHHRVRRVVVIGEVALSLVLACGAILLLRSLNKLQELETGVRIDQVLTMSLSLPKRTYPTPGQAATFYQALSERMAAVPGVVQPAITTHLPLRWIGNGEGIEVPGVAQPINVRFKRVDAGYFGAFGIPITAGRDLSTRDNFGGKRVMVINEILAKRLTEATGVTNPVGQVVGLYCPKYIERGTTTEKVEIVGVIRSERTADPGQSDPAVVYVPLAQVPAQGIQLAIRTGSENAASVMTGVREAMRQVDPNLPIAEVATMQEVRDSTLTGVSRPAWLIGVFAAIAALLTAIGLYGVLAQAVQQQRREIGIRMALGARGGDIVSHVLRNGFVLVLAGLAVGGFGTFAFTRVLKGMLYEISTLDPVAISAACAVMALIGVLASFIPACRAARVDPVTTLRDE